MDRTYTFHIQGTSNLFDTTTTTSFSFTLSSPPPLPSSLSRQIVTNRQTITNSSSCDSSLWDPSLFDVYGIQTYPSGLTLLPPSVRYSPLTITTKALSLCDENGFSKDILSPATFQWEFVSNDTNINDNVEINDWKRGTMLIIPSDILTDRDIFPPNVPRLLRVSVTFEEEDVTLLAEVSLQFLPSPIEMKVQMGFSSVFDVEKRLVIDLTDSSTMDGLVVEGEGAGEWQWEWQWSCMVVHRNGDNTIEQGEECRYESGAMVVMPGEGEGRFESQQGETFREGEAYYFSVKSRVREGEGENEKKIRQGINHKNVT